MMQIVRCESAVAQGLRSDKHPKCDKRERQMRQTSTPLTPYGQLVADFSTFNQPCS